MKEKTIEFLKWYIQFKVRLIKQMLVWLSGKKAIIASIILTTIGYLGAKGTLSEIDILFIGSIVTILFGSASYATKKFIYKN